MSTPYNINGPRHRMIHIIDDSSESDEDDKRRSDGIDYEEKHNLGRQVEHSLVTVKDSSVDDIADQLLGLDICRKKMISPIRLKDSTRSNNEMKGIVNASECQEQIEESKIHNCIPSYIEEMLFAHQRIGIEWLLNLYKIPSGGILADDMGLGKTLQVTAFVASLLKAKLAKRILILAPKTLVSAWEKEVKICKLSHLTFEYTGDKKTRESIRNTVVEEGGILLTTYGMVQHNAQQLREHDSHDEDDGNLWDVLIMDEGHKLKNQKAQLRQKIESIPAKMRLIITGTPIQNNLMELHSLFDLVCPDLFGPLKDFKEQFAKPIVSGTDKNATQREREDAAIVSESLRKTFAPFMLRRTKEEVFQRSGDVDDKTATDAPSSLPRSPIMLSKKKDFVVWLRLTNNQEKLYRAFLESKSVAAVLNKTSSALASLTVLKKICDHPALLSESAQETILEVQATEEDAGRISQSFDEMRNSLEWQSVLEELSTSKIQASCKSIFVMHLLERLTKDHRTLVFSQSKVMLDVLESAIISRGWTCLRIDGSVPSTERQNRVQRFQSDESIQVFLLTSQVGGLGLTLTGADRVVIVDPSWNPSVDSQSVDRAYRIGQTRDVIVYRLVSCGTIEDKIYRKQVFKGALFKAGTEQGEQLRYFSLSDLKDLFTLDAREVLHSSTHKRLEQLHGHQREISISMAQELDALTSIPEFVGVSDHDLLYSETKDIPESVLSRARAFKSKSGNNAPDAKGKQPTWEGDQELSTMFDRALSFQKTHDDQDLKNKLIEELENQRKLAKNQALLSSLPDRGQRILNRIKKLEMDLQKMGKNIPEDSHNHKASTSDFYDMKARASPHDATEHILEKVQTEIQDSKSPLKAYWHGSTQTTTKEEKAIILKHTMKKKKKELYLKSLDLERAMQDEDTDDENVSLLRKEVKVLLAEFVDSKAQLDKFHKEL